MWHMEHPYMRPDFNLSIFALASFGVLKEDDIKYYETELTCGSSTGVIDRAGIEKITPSWW